MSVTVDEDEILALADQLRTDAGCAVPVDLGRVAQHLGIPVRESHKLGRNLPGFFYDYPPLRVIVLNGYHSRERKRFTLGHECWHVLRGEGGLSLCGCEPDQDYEPWEERAANRFAGALLMPREQLCRAWEACQDPQRLMRLFGVSRRALCIELRENELAIL